MEHEAETYQQRLQAIAEKRQIQEEQERIRREKEDERLRLQQLKRKSLRDQWLMEGPPTSPDSTGPRSPLWGPKAQEIEKHFEKLQETSEWLAEEEVKLNKHIEDGPALTVADAETHSKVETAMVPVETVAETAPNGPIMESGKDEKKDDPVHTENHNSNEAGPVVDVKVEAFTTTPSAVVNGNMEREYSHFTPEQDEEPHTNSLAIHSLEGSDAGGITMTFLGFKEAEPGHGVNEDDEVGEIIRAERVIITDEGEEIAAYDTSTTEESAMPVANEDTPRSTEEMGDVEETENHLEPYADIELAGSSEVSQNLDSSAEKVVTGLTVGEDRMDPELPETQLQNETLDGAIEVSQVPVYSTTQPSPTIRPKAEGEAVESQPPKEEEAVAAIRISLSQFQEVPLDGVGEKAESSTMAGTERPTAEQEPLLVSKASAQLDTSSPNQPEGVPKQKTCQCCSII